MLIELPAHVLELSGPDAVAFAHAQFSSDLRTLDAGTWQWSAWLTAQGRVRCWFALLRVADDRLLLCLRGTDAAALRADLARFVFRSKLTLDAGPMHVYGADARSAAGAPGNLPSGKQLLLHEETAALRLPGGERYVLLSREPMRAAAGDASAVAQWRLDDIRAGLPDLGPGLQERFLPQWLGLDRLGAVSIAKGCYPGQEIMARLHFKGGNKRGLYRIAFSAAALPQPGTELRRTDTQGEAGTVLVVARSGAADAEALATLLDESASLPMQAAEIPLRDIQVISRFG